MEALHPGGTINLSWVVDNDTLDLKISDDGPGIPDEIIDTLFEPFVTSGKRQGTGLGLAIAKKIVEEHGGNIAVISESGGGACFIVSLAFQDGHKPQNENVEPELKGARR
jgi:signal transduction histidine kinase